MTTQLAFHDTHFDIVDRNGQPWLRSTQIAEALGYANDNAITRIYNRNADEFTVGMSEKVSLTLSGNLQTEARIFSLRGAHLLAMFARTKVAKEFRRWVLDVLDSLGAATQPQRKGKQKALPGALTLEQREAVQAMVLGRVRACDKQLQGAAAMKLWSIIKAKFGCSYKEIPAEQFPEVLSLVARQELEGELMPLELEAPKSAARYHYPAEWIIQQNRHPWQTRPGYGVRGADMETRAIDLQLMDAHPTQHLLNALQANGHDVTAAQVEYKALRDHLNWAINTRKTIEGYASQIVEQCQWLANAVSVAKDVARPMLKR